MAFNFLKKKKQEEEKLDIPPLPKDDFDLSLQVNSSIPLNQPPQGSATPYGDLQASGFSFKTNTTLNTMNAGSSTSGPQYNIGPKISPMETPDPDLRPGAYLGVEHEEAPPLPKQKQKTSPMESIQGSMQHDPFMGHDEPVFANSPPLPKPQTQKKDPFLDTMEDPPHPNMDEEVPKPPAIFSEDEDVDDESILGHDEYKLSKEQEKRLLETLGREKIEKPKLREYHPDTPLFITIDGYKEILADIEHVNATLKASEEVLDRLNELKNTKDKEFEKWRSELEDVQRKLLYVDKVIFER